VTVRNGLVLEIQNVPADGNPATPLPLVPTSVEALFDVIAGESLTADAIDVTYSYVGVPTSITVDRTLGAVDDEVYYTASLAPTLR
jgi:hypothetical protein